MLTKADLAESEEQVEQVADRVRSLAGPDVRTLVVSDGNAESVEAVRALMAPGTTTVLVGKSGVGKSSLVNMLVGEEVQETGTVREGDQVTVDADKDGGFTVVCDNTPAATYEVPDAE